MVMRTPRPPAISPRVNSGIPLRSGARITILVSMALLAMTLLPWIGATRAVLAQGQRFITLASTTSTENSGLFAHILPRFTARSGIAVRVVAKGTGAALRLARHGDADVLLVHHRPSEDKFVAAGEGIERRDVMYNDFVLIGPRSDPAGVRGMKDVVGAFKNIAHRRARGVSRGDDSGTHKTELGIWQRTGIAVRGQPTKWYREAGSGMGATLNTAAAMEAYLLADRGTWLSFGNRRGLEIVVEGDPRLFNPYGVILVNPARHPHVKAAEGRAFIAWLTGAEGKAAIASFRLGGKQLFHPATQ